MTIDEFSKVELKVGTVRAAEPVEGSSKLLKLQIDLGEAAPRQVLSGIAAHYTPEQMLGRQVIVVANLDPRAMMGLESQGMVLAAGAGEGNGIALLGVDKEVPPGSEVR